MLHYPLLVSPIQEDGVEKPARLQWVDLTKGILAICVVAIHAYKEVQDQLPVYSLQWVLVTAAGRCLQFTVPTFLLISVFLGTQSLLYGKPVKSYLAARLRSTLWPLAIWSLVIAGYIWWKAPERGPLTSLMRVWSGQEDYHLYFLRVLLQIGLVLPLLIPLTRWRLSFNVTAAFIAALTLLVFLSNRYWWGIRDAASYGFWYLPSIGFGLWFGSHNKEARPDFRWLPLLALLSLGVYLPLSIQLEAKIDVRSWLLPVSWWAYSATAGMTLLVLCERLDPRSIQRYFKALEVIGRRSLPIYLLHPLPLLAINWLLRRTHFGGLSSLPVHGLAQVALLLIFSLLCSIVATLVLERLRLSRWFFGR